MDYQIEKKNQYQGIEEFDLAKRLDKYGLEKVLSFIEGIYTKHPSTRNGYAKLGNVFRAKNKTEIALEYFEIDRSNNRISPAYRHILAFLLGQLNRKKDADEEFHRARLEDPSLTFGYMFFDLKCGSTYPINRYGKTPKYYSNDLACVSKQLIMDSQLFAQLGYWEQADELVHKAYTVETEMVDGYAFIGSVLKAYCRFEDALCYYEKDNQAGRLSPFQRLQYAQLLTYSGFAIKAEQEVQRAYDQDHKLQDGFAIIGSVFRVNGQYDVAHDYYEKDYNLNKLSAAHRHIFADHLSRKGRLDDAIEEIRQAYREDSFLENGYARIGNILREQNKLDKALQLYQIDRKKNRLSLVHLCIYADLLAQTGLFDEAVGHIEQIFKLDAKFYCSRLSHSWFIKIIQLFAKAGKIKETRFTCDYFKKCFSTKNDIYSYAANYFSSDDNTFSVEFYEKDFISGRQSPKNKILYAKKLVGLNHSYLSKALKIVSIAYKEDLNVKNGYSLIAASLQAMYNKQYIKSLYENDFINKRLTNSMMHKYIEYVFILEGVESSTDLVERCYSFLSYFTDCYCVIATKLLGYQGTNKAIAFFEKDLVQDKINEDNLYTYIKCVMQTKKNTDILRLVSGDTISLLMQARFNKAAKLSNVALPVSFPLIPDNLLKTAKDVLEYSSSLVCVGKNKEARTVLQNYYGCCSETIDAFSTCARTALELADNKIAKDFFEQDLQYGRASANSLFQYAEMLYDGGESKAASNIYTKAFAKISKGKVEDQWLSDHKNAYCGKTCYVLGAGPSLKDVDVNKLSGEIVFATNGAYLLPELAIDFYVTVSEQFWRHHKTEIENLDCKRFFLPYTLFDHLSPKRKASWFNVPELKNLDMIEQKIPVPYAFSGDASKLVFTGGTVIFVCLQLAYHLGFSRVILLGVDHNFSHLDIPNKGCFSTDKLLNLHFSKTYYSNSGVLHIDQNAVMRGYKLCQEKFALSGRKILNASQGTCLDVFPKVDFNDVVS